MLRCYWLYLLLFDKVCSFRQTISVGTLHSCALLQGCALKCWGNNNDGKLGYGNTETRGDEPDEMGEHLPTVNLGTDRCAVSLALGELHTCALLDNGAVKCWGGNEKGQLGQGGIDTWGSSPSTTVDSLPEIELGAGLAAVSITAGRDFTCALLSNNSVKCWGDNSRYQLGTTTVLSGAMGDTVDLGADFIPVLVMSGCYSQHVCAISTTGRLQCWGDNSQCQLGKGPQGPDARQAANTVFPNVSIPLGSGRKAVSVAIGGLHTCVLLDNGSVKCWGQGWWGKLGYEDTKMRGCSSTENEMTQEMGDNLAAVDLGTGLIAVAITAGQDFTCALLSCGLVKCWGGNGVAQLGQGKGGHQGDEPDEMGDFLAFTDVGSLKVSAIASGLSHSVVLLEDGSVKAWGSNFVGKLGLGNTNDRGLEPEDMGNNLPVVELAGVVRSMPPRGSLCPLGAFGQNKCILCAAGTWALAGAVSGDDCIACPIGYSGASKGATRCELCIEGTFSPIAGMVRCLFCASADTCQAARLHVCQSSDDLLAFRIDDKVDDTSYFFVEQEGRVRINTNVFDEAAETLVVGGDSRFRGQVFLDHSDMPLSEQLVQKVKHVEKEILLQSGKAVIQWQDDIWVESDSWLKKDILLDVHIVYGTETVLLTVASPENLHSLAPVPQAWWTGPITEVQPNGDDDDALEVVVGFTIHVVMDESLEEATVHWTVVGVSAS